MTKTTGRIDENLMAEAAQALRYGAGSGAIEPATLKRFLAVLEWLAGAGYRHGEGEMTTTLASGETFHNHTSFGLLSLVLATDSPASVVLVRCGAAHTLAMPVPAASLKAVEVYRLARQEAPHA
jgi:hypothetical protein